MLEWETQKGNVAHVSSENQQFIMKDDIAIIWTQLKNTTETPDVK